MTTSDGTSSSQHTFTGTQNQSRPYRTAQLFRQAANNPQYTLADMQNQSRPNPEAQLPSQVVHNPIGYTNEMENNHSLGFLDPLATPYPTWSSQSGTNTPEIPAPTGSYDFQSQALPTPSMEPQTPMTSQPSFTTLNQSSGYQMQSTMGYTSQPEPLPQWNIPPGPGIESNLSKLDTIHTHTGFPMHSPVSSSHEFAASPSVSISSPSSFPQQRQGRRASTASRQTRASSSISNPLQRHNRAGGIQKPCRKNPKTPQQVPSSRASLRSSPPLLEWWVDDKQLIRLDFDKNGQRISFSVRCYHKKMASLVDLDFAREKGFEVHPIPLGLRRVQETPFGKRTAENFSKMKVRCPMGSVMPLKSFNPRAMTLWGEEEAQMTLGRDGCRELGLLTVLEGELCDLIVCFIVTSEVISC